MKNQEIKKERIYVTPNVEVIEMAVEQPFAVSGNSAESLRWNEEDMAW